MADNSKIEARMVDYQYFSYVYVAQVHVT